VRVNTKVVMDIETGAVLERKSYEYSGAVERCDPATLTLIATIASLAGTGTSLGLSLANQPGGPPKPQPTPPGVTALQNTERQNAEKAAIGGQVPNILASTSGLANPEYVAQIAQLLSGTAGQSGSSGAAQDAIKKAFGITTGGTAGGTPGVQGTSTSNFKPAGVDTNPNPGSAPVNLSDFVTSFLYK
jgi:hypothetical protein